MIVPESEINAKKNEMSSELTVHASFGIVVTERKLTTSFSLYGCHATTKNLKTEMLSAIID